MLKFIRIAWSLLIGVALRAARVDATRYRALDFSPFDETLAGRSSSRDAELGAFLHAASLATIQQSMDRGEITSVDLTLYCLARIRALDGGSHALIQLDPDVLSWARASDERRASSGRLSRLDGIPVTLKDNIETAGPLRTTAGAMALADHVAGRDAELVTGLHDAGAVIIGKANLSELAGAVTRTPGVSAVGGRTVNPYGRDFTPGGSSSGSAVSVAAGFCLTSIGTETSGSLIAPAASNGVVGMMPSRGLVSTGGVVPLVRSQDSPGPVARCVSDAADLLSAMSDMEMPAELRTDALADIAVGLLRADILAQPSTFEDTSDNPAAVSRIQDGLGKAGAVVKSVTLADEEGRASFESGFAKVVIGGLTHDTMSYLAVANAPAADIASLHAYNLRRPRWRMPRGQFFVDLAYFLDIDRGTYERTVRQHQDLAERMLAATFAVNEVEMLVSLGNCHSSLYASAGYPAITVPLGLRSSGMPMGATLIGRAGEDGNLLEYAYAFEQATNLRVAPPIVSRR